MPDKKNGPPQGIEYKIQFGETDGFRYIGVQPPLPTEDIRHFRSAVEEELEGTYSFVTSSIRRSPEEGNPYTEIGIMGDPDKGQLTNAAHRAMDTVKYPADSYTISEKVHGIGWGLYLFGGRANTRG